MTNYTKEWDIMKLAIVGSRTFTDYNKMKKEILKAVNIEDVELIVSGGAQGTDALAERFAEEYNIPTNIIYPNWIIGRQAGIMRNARIVDESDRVIAFWDGKSRGTKFTINYCKRCNKDIVVCRSD